MKETIYTLAEECNQLLREESGIRLAVGKRLLAIRVHFCGEGKLTQGVRRATSSMGRFYEFCSENIRGANGRPLAERTIENYIVGAKNPAEFIRADAASHNNTAKDRVTRQNLRAAVGLPTVPKLADLPKPKASDAPLAPRQLRNDPDVANEVNALATAWEKASEIARRQFLYMIGAHL